MVGRGSWWWWWRMRPVDGRKERADQQSVIWYWPHLVLGVVLLRSVLFLLFVSPPFVVCQPSTDPPTCCCPPLPETTTHTYTHCPCRLCGNFGSARRCVASPRWFYLFAPLSFRLLFATSGCCCFVWVGCCCAMQLPREATTTQPDELMLQLQSSPSQLLIRASAAASDQPTALPAMHQISPKIESTDSSFNNNNNNGHSDVSSSNIFLDPFFFETLVEDSIWPGPKRNVYSSATVGVHFVRRTHLTLRCRACAVLGFFFFFLFSRLLRSVVVHP